MTIVPEEYLLTLEAVRERCYEVYDKGKQNQLDYFDIDETQFDKVVTHVEQVTHQRFGNQYDKIPPHSRLNHFGTDRVAELYQQWAADGKDPLEQTRMVMDLIMVSVLVDAGAGQQWVYTCSNGDKIGRSEGLAIASLDMFVKGYFSHDPNHKQQVTAQGLELLTVDQMAKGFQVSDENPMAGLEGRVQLLQKLPLILTQQVFFQRGTSCRPGHLVDYLLEKSPDKIIQVREVWQVVMGLGPMWPARYVIHDVPLGDVWPIPCLMDRGNYENMVPFHKLSQWLTYSLLDGLQQSALGLQVEGLEVMTGLPEYRNGGLLVDHGVLKLKPKEYERGIHYAQDQHQQDLTVPLFDGSDPLIVEWRALTVVFLDKIHQAVQQKLQVSLTLAQVLEAGTWTAGREIAAQLRPSHGGPPIAIKSDGTIF
ncbi:DUF1688-domain-containing protein [Hesseltinella vesiculosa]|uniref:DUF1688-domain-containing protein n=1 Tax=Hesseltinella vesiculosa TaxID=101127 RepID=A0A1X2GN11_9FUNG|nr:DUF1688-domain-containing protein [Hesseltinella vesiculosa]